LSQLRRLTLTCPNDGGGICHPEGGICHLDGGFATWTVDLLPIEMPVDFSDTDLVTTGRTGMDDQSFYLECVGGSESLKACLAAKGADQWAQERHQQAAELKIFKKTKRGLFCLSDVASKNAYVYLQDTQTELTPDEQRMLRKRYRLRELYIYQQRVNAKGDSYYEHIETIILHRSRIVAAEAAPTTSKKSRQSRKSKRSRKASRDNSKRSAGIIALAVVILLIIICLIVAWVVRCREDRCSEE
jgi:hypothetical protein